MKTEMVKYNDEERKKKLKIPRTKIRFYCGTCKKYFKHKKSLKYHKLKHDDAKQFTRVINSNVINSPPARYQSVNSSEKSFICSTYNIRYFHCITCNIKFKNKNTIKSHEILHMGIKQFECNICNKKFALKRYVTTHQRIHLKGNKGSNYRVNQKGKYKLRKIIKHCIEQYSCDICNKLFINEKSLKCHKQFHAKEKPFICRICKTEFSQKIQLINHLRNLFTCNVCHKRFVTEKQFKRHLSTHQGKSYFVCNICDKHLMEEELNKHQKFHLKIRPFFCDICDLGFELEEETIAHKLKIHFRLSGLSIELM